MQIFRSWNLSGGLKRFSEDVPGPEVDVIPGWSFYSDSAKEFVGQGYGAGITAGPAGSFKVVGSRFDADEPCRFEEGVENSRDLASSFGF